jgi:hypothetical protein
MKGCAMRLKSRLGLLALTTAITAGAIAAPKPAQAHVFFGFGIGVPVYAPYYYHPHYYRPYYYAPAPVYYPPYNPVPGGYTCYAGPYVCPLHYAHPINAPCSCPADGGGRVGGVTR